MKKFYFMLFSVLITVGCVNNGPPEPYGAIPSQRQMLWHQMKYHAFIHFGPNTFTDNEWGQGDESPDLFNPKEMDCRQWIKTIKEAGMEGAVITAKHHDGFCLWPSKYSNHTVRQSKWRHGKGDVLKDLSEACREFGIKFGIYISPWDRNHPSYFSDQYNVIFKKMLKEVLSSYGEVYYLFLDGAFSVGPDGKRQVYDWDGFIQIIRRFQPNAVIFSDAGPDVRWVGNEEGFAAETNWCTVKKGIFYPGISGVNDQLQTGHEDGQLWIPTEVNTSIRPGWFYHKSEDQKVKPLRQLITNWFHSVGMNGNFLLNIPPDKRGLIHENDMKRLLEFRQWLDKAFTLNYAKSATVTATNTRSHEYRAINSIDENPHTYWATEVHILEASLEIDFGQTIEVNALLIQEYIPLGQRIKLFAIDVLIENKYTQVARGVTVGNRRIIQFKPTRAKKLRITINAKACPLISNIEVYRIPDRNCTNLPPVYSYKYN